MAYGNYQQNNFNYGNRTNNGGYQRNNYNNQQGNGGNYQQQRPEPEPKPPFNLDEFIEERLDVYSRFIEVIKEKGLDPAEFAFAIGGWVTSAVLEKRKG